MILSDNKKLIKKLSAEGNEEECMAKNNKRKSSVARKMAGILIVLGLITGLMCFLNLMAYDVLEEYNVSLQETVAGL